MWRVTRLHRRVGRSGSRLLPYGDCFQALPIRTEPACHDQGISVKENVGTGSKMERRRVECRPTWGMRQTSTVGAIRRLKDRTWRRSGRMNTSEGGRTGKDMAEGDAGDDRSSDAGGQRRGHDQGLTTDRTEMLLEPGVGVSARLVAGNIGHRGGLTISEQLATPLVRRLLDSCFILHLSCFWRACL